MNSYSKEIEYYNSHIEDLNKKHEELVETKENVSSPEYIEEAAREFEQLQDKQQEMAQTILYRTIYT